MKLLVLVQVPFLSEASTADITFEWPVSCVDANVVDEVPCFVEESSTVVVLADVVPYISSTPFVVFVAGSVLVLR